MQISRVKAQITYRLREGIPLTNEMYDYLRASLKERDMLKKKLQKLQTDEFLAKEKEKIEKRAPAIIKMRITTKVMRNQPLTEPERRFLRVKGGTAYLKRLLKMYPAYPHW